MITNFSPDQKAVASALLELAEQLEIECIRHFINTYSQLTISDNRQGRIEAIKAIQGMSGKRPIGDKIRDVFNPEV